MNRWYALGAGRHDAARSVAGARLDTFKGMTVVEFRADSAADALDRAERFVDTYALFTEAEWHTATGRLVGAAGAVVVEAVTL